MTTPQPLATVPTTTARPARDSAGRTIALDDTVVLTAADGGPAARCVVTAIDPSGVVVTVAGNGRTIRVLAARVQVTDR